jgi:hypothetical protein
MGSIGVGLVVTLMGLAYGLGLLTGDWVNKALGRFLARRHHTR